MSFQSVEDIREVLASGGVSVRAQLRHYLRVKGFASRGSDHDAPTIR
jgi:hypothetical protein